MNDAYIVRRGGGMSINRSAIIVTAPSGSNVIATDGSNTKRAIEKNGVWVFVNLSSGKWTVISTLLDNKNVIPIDITRPNYYYVTVTYRDYLYNSGDQCNDVTGGWVAWTERYGHPDYESGIVRFNSDSIYFECPVNYGVGRSAAVHTRQKIKISKNTLWLEVASSTGSFNSRLILRSRITTGTNDIVASVKYWGGPSIVKMDVSSFYGQMFYVDVLHEQTGGDPSTNATIKRVWLEDV